MKAKIKKGAEYLFSEGASNNWNDLKENDDMIINFSEKYTYKSFKQVKNHLLIEVGNEFMKNDVVDIVFTGDIPTLEFESFCKDQLVLYIKRK